MIRPTAGDPTTQEYGGHMPPCPQFQDCFILCERRLWGLMTSRLDDILDSLPSTSNTGAAWAAVDQWVSVGDIGTVIELYRALRPTLEEPQAWAARSVADHVEAKICLTRGPGIPAAVVTLAEIQPTRTMRLASMAASAQPLEVFAQLARSVPDTPAGVDLLGRWLHEEVIRGAPVSEHSSLRDLAATLSGAGHELGNLPVHRLPLEARAGLAFPAYHANGQSWPLPDRQGTPLLDRLGSTTPLVAITEARFDEEASAPFVDWIEHSNGRVETRLLDGPQQSMPSLALLRAIGLEATAAGAKLSGVETDAAGAYRELFSAASGGGAYSWGLYGAGGRLAAWRSLAALAGASCNDVGGAAVAAEACRWLSFKSDKFFDHVAWDVGLAALRPTGRIAALTATDTD